MRVIIQHGSEWLHFTNPVEVLTARTPDEVFQCLEAIALRHSASRREGNPGGLWAAGFVSYEASSAFDDALKTHEPDGLPLLQFGLFQSLEKVEPKSSGDYSLRDWEPSVGRDEYSEAIGVIKEHIAAGDTYQVNYTFRLNADFAGDSFAFF